MKFWSIFLLIITTACSSGKPPKNATKILKSSLFPNIEAKKITGVSLEMPGDRIGQEKMDELKTVHAEWVAMIPYGYTEKNDAKVQFHYESHWWGESLNGTKDLIQMAQKAGLKVMLKPHVWVVGQGWPGDFDLKTEAEWLIWEKSYHKYIIANAHIADSFSVDLFCIGTEYRKAIVKRLDFWKKLIVDVKKIYKGPITYAANWDNYKRVKFWDQLDFIGIDAYFPLSDAAIPELDELKKNWQPIENKLEQFSKKQNKKIIFTEYGYKSVEYTNSGYWNYSDDTVKVNMKTQANAYRALFETVWQKDWMLGGFFWKWHMHDSENIGGPNNDRYTPQNKTAFHVIQEWYGEK